jgi:hypothetical protein
MGAKSASAASAAKEVGLSRVIDLVRRAVFVNLHPADGIGRGCHLIIFWLL